MALPSSMGFRLVLGAQTYMQGKHKEKAQWWISKEAILFGEPKDEFLKVAWNCGAWADQETWQQLVWSHLGFGLVALLSSCIPTRKME